MVITPKDVKTPKDVNLFDLKKAFDTVAEVIVK